MPVSVPPAGGGAEHSPTQQFLPLRFQRFMGLIVAGARGGGERGEGHCWGRDTQVVFLSVGGSGREKLVY